MSSVYFLLVILYCLGLVCSQQCNNTVYPYYINSTNTLKSGASNRLKIGILGSFAGRDPITANAFAFYLNNRADILPNVAIDLYISTSKTTSDVLLGTLSHISNLQVQGLISGFTSVESRTAQLAAKIYSIPQISSNALSYTLSNKAEYPFFMRTIPADTIQIGGIIALFQKMKWKKAIVVYTDDDYGTGYQRLQAAGAPKNISFYPVSLSATAKVLADVSGTVDAINQAVREQDYRIIVYYTQLIPSDLVRAGLNATGTFGPGFVSVLTASVSGQYITGLQSSPLNDGVIGLTVAGQRGDFFKTFYSDWSSPTTTNPFPLQDIFYQAYYMADAVYTFALGLDMLLKNGTQFQNVKGAALYAAMNSLNFLGTTGNVRYDNNGDRLGDYSIYSILPKSSIEIGIYSADNDTFVQTKDAVFYGGSTEIPRDSPFKCPACFHGTCVQDVGCVCKGGYHGSDCSDKEGSQIALIAGLVGGGCIMIFVLVAAFFFYRRQRYQLVKEVAERQRSNIARSDLKIHERIGRGASGEVFKASFRGTDVAVKKIITSSVDKSVIQEFELEVAIMCGLRHPNIILFMGSCHDIEGKEMLLVMELMARGSLHDVLHNNKIELTFEMKLHLACQAAQGMNFLHQSSPPIIHRDLKSHNILLDDKWNARISDFGITKFKESNKSGKGTHEKSMGTIYWSSPEFLQGLELTEKSDVYAYGIVLWEIFHQQNPYSGRDPIAVALEVIHNDLRPTIHHDVPSDMRELIQACWHKNAEHRPSFEEIMTTLKSMSMVNPSLTVHTSRMRIEAPTGMIFMVKTNVQNAFSIWESNPIEMCDAMTLHNGLMRANIELYRGYESLCDLHGFVIAFSSLEDALNFCIATQISMLHVSWPINLLKVPSCAQYTNSAGEVLWNGLRIQMSIYSGVPNCERDPVTDRMTYTGPVAEKAQRMLRGIKKGSIVVTDTIVDEINRKKIRTMQPITTQKCGEMNDSARDGKSAIHRVTINCLHERDTTNLQAPSPHVVMDVDQVVTLNSDPIASPGTDRGAWDANAQVATVSWLAKYSDFDLKESIGKGSMGDYTRATWKSKDVAVKMMVNQKLKEDDMLRLMSDAAIMSTITHPNLLQFHAVCVESGHLSMISEYMAKGNLKAMLADNTISLTMHKRLQMGLSVAHGMAYLTTHPHSSMQKHDNLKSHNVLVGKNWEVKVGDFGQSNLRDLARTMTSVGSVAWTAPELLTGDAESSPKIATYSYGVILWELYTRQVPYANEHPIRVVSKILNGYRPPIPVGCPPVLSTLISECLSTDPEDRPSWDTIITTLSTIVNTMST